jgi:phage-related protein
VADRTLTVKFVGDANQLSKTFGKVGDEGDTFGKKMGSGAGKGIGVMSKAAGIATIAIAGGLSAALIHAVKDQEANEKANAQTAAAIKSTGDAANVTSPHIQDLADHIEKMSGMDGLAVQKGENMLLTFTNIRNGVGKNNQIFDEATKTLADMSTAMGADPQKQAIALGKALNDPVKGVTALTKVGVTFTASQKASIDAMVKHGETAQAQKVILGELNKEFGGSAEAAGKTMAGQVKILEARLDDMGDAIAVKVIPVLTSLMSWVEDHWPQISKVILGVANEVIAWFQANWPQIRQIAEQVFTAVKSAWENDLHPALLQIEAVTAWLVGQVRQHWDAIHQVIEGVMTVIKGVIDVIMGLIQGDWGRAWNGIKEIVSGSLSAMEGLIKLGWDVFKQAMSTLGAKALEGIKAGLGDLGGWAKGELAKLPAQAVAAGGTLLSAASDLGGKILSGLKTGVGDLASWAGSEIGKVGNAISGAAGDVLSDAGKIATAIANGIKSAPGKLVGLAGDLTGGLKDALGQVGKDILGIASGLGESIANALKAPINAFIGGWNGLSFSIPALDTHLPGVGKVGGVTVSTPNIGKLALGGITTGPMLSWIGDNPSGREAVIPLDSPHANSLLGGGGGDVTINVTIMGGGAQAGQDAYQELVTLARRGTGNATFRQVFAG